MSDISLVECLCLRLRVRRRLRRHCLSPRSRVESVESHIVKVGQNPGTPPHRRRQSSLVSSQADQAQAHPKFRTVTAKAITFRAHGSGSDGTTVEEYPEYHLAVETHQDQPRRTFGR